MFAHQVIDFHNNTGLRDINNDIRESTKFHITNSDDILNLFNRSKFTEPMLRFLAGLPAYGGGNHTYADRTKTEL